MAKRLNGHLKKTEIKSLKNVLIAEKERIINKQINDRAGETFTIKDTSKDEVDSANNTILMSTELRFSNRDQLFLKKINQSLELVETEEYGMCQECGAAITFSRLKARPTSELCINCKEENERFEHQSARISKSVNSPAF